MMIPIDDALAVFREFVEDELGFDLDEERFADIRKLLEEKIPGGPMPFKTGGLVQKNLFYDRECGYDFTPFKPEPAMPADKPCDNTCSGPEEGIQLLPHQQDLMDAHVRKVAQSMIHGAISRIAPEKPIGRVAEVRPDGTIIVEIFGNPTQAAMWLEDNRAWIENPMSIKVSDPIQVLDSRAPNFSERLAENREKITQALGVPENELLAVHDEVEVVDKTLKDCENKFNPPVEFGGFDPVLKTERTCSECYGTGYERGFGGPCPKGCQS